MTTAQLGMRSGYAVVCVGIAYLIVLGAGMARYGFSAPIRDPLLAVMEVLTILSALPILALFVALHASIAPAQRLWGTLALLFAAMFCFATMGVHLVELTAGRALARPGLVWPAFPYAIELFAWDFLLGVALLLAAQALPRGQDARRLRGWLRVTGWLCLAGLFGPLVGQMRLQLVGVAGYAVLMPAVAWMMARWLQRPSGGELIGPA